MATDGRPVTATAHGYAMKRRRLMLILEATTGGTRRHLMDLVTGLDPRRFAIRVVCACSRDPAFDDDIAAMRRQSIPVHVIPMVRNVAPWRDGRAYRALVRLMRQYPCDLVHTHSAKAGVLGRMAAWRIGLTPVVHTPHVFPFDMQVNPLSRIAYRAVERLLARRTARLVCVSWAGILSGMRARVAPAGRYAMIYNGVELPELSDDAAAAVTFRRDLGLSVSTPLVGAVGRLTRQKNYALLIDAAQAVIRRIPEARFVIIGEGEARPRLEDRIARLGLSDRVLLPGYRKDVMACYAGFDVFAMSSAWEGLPYSLLEAMAACKPVVATAVGGVGEAVRPGIDGVLTPPGDAGALANALMGCLQAPTDVRGRMGRSARGRIDRVFSRRRMLDAIETLYEDLTPDAGVTDKEENQ